MKPLLLAFKLLSEIFQNIHNVVDGVEQHGEGHRLGTLALWAVKIHLKMFGLLKPLKPER